MGLKIVLWKKMEFSICRIEQKGEQHWDVESREGYASIQFDGSLKPQNPLFGKQPYLDADEGMRYELILPQTEGLLAVYQHKEWWIRPKFPRCVEEIPEKTQLLLGKSQKGYYAVLAVSRSTLERAHEIHYGGANWRQIDAAVAHIAGLLLRKGKI